MIKIKKLRYETPSYNLKKFISKWNLSADKPIVLHIYDGGKYDFTVDWGDV
ncbi:hypothetical protein [Ichthyobacterium seriolicida]|uniref:Uncharacterized protein n=1 Tax=Ichthyobacterium seriolicida TaxID=242600 RepID=A0A1J1DYA2_9FLAO|nr:hypothetical protein [Ichthyobacterium seriolicida]BAV94863.1 hypothetical protein JBKA6_0850 [Ichthyobacterium seriolicida]